MLAAVNPTSNGFGGGSRTASGFPTSINGQMNFPGTPAQTPPGVNGAKIIEARNNRGSNVMLPYARVVPMHAQVNPRAREPGDKRLVNVNGRPRLEYEGLRGGEVAFVLGRRFKTDGAELEESQRYAHQAFAGVGHGVDRMQRLASLDWVEALFQERIGAAARVDLHSLVLTDYVAHDSGIREARALLAGSTALFANDVTAHMQRQAGAAAPQTYMNGIFVMERGPFLRGFMVDVNKPAPVKQPNSLGEGLDVARNMGDLLAFAGLNCKLKLMNLFDWSPDGLVLSKLESPAGDEQGSAALDARSAQLFNVAVQGPAISTSWTSDLRDHKLQVQPLDKVFVCLVADLEYQLDTDAVKEELRRARTAAENVMKKITGAPGAAGDPWINNTLEQLMDLATLAAGAIGSVAPTDGPFKPEEDAVDAAKPPDGGFTEKGPADAKQAEVDAQQALVDAKQAEVDAAQELADDATAARDAKQAEVTGKRGLANAAPPGAAKTALGAEVTALEAELATLETARAAAVAALAALKAELTPLETALTALETALTPLAAALAAVEKAYSDAVSALAQAKKDALDGWSDNPATLKGQMENFLKLADEVRAGTLLPSKATLSNFRLMRSTSSHMANYSHFNPLSPATSRCGLPLGNVRAGNTKGRASYIVGAWCIGTVLDSAASRSTIGSMTRVSPASMAIQLNVDISWWSADKLYRHYMDYGGLVLQRGQKRPGARPEAAKEEHLGDDVTQGRKYAKTDSENPVRAATPV